MFHNPSVEREMFVSESLKTEYFRVAMPTLLFVINISHPFLYSCFHFMGDLSNSKHSVVEQISLNQDVSSHLELILCNSLILPASAP